MRLLNKFSLLIFHELIFEHSRFIGIDREIEKNLADINGAANILRKAFPKVTQWDRGVVDTPCDVRAA